MKSIELNKAVRKEFKCTNC